MEQFGKYVVSFIFICNCDTGQREVMNEYHQWKRWVREERKKVRYQAMIFLELAKAVM